MPIKPREIRSKNVPIVKFDDAKYGITKITKSTKGKPNRGPVFEETKTAQINEEFVYIISPLSCSRIANIEVKSILDHLKDIEQMSIPFLYTD